MSNIMPLFATAPRLKLRIYDKLIAYAVGFNIAVSVDVQPVFVIGSYAPVSLEPTLYNTVTGTMQIVRLLSRDSLAAKEAVVNAATGETTPAKIAFQGVDAGELTSTAPSGTATATNSPLLQRDLFTHVDPEKLLISRTFNVSVYMKVPNGTLDGLEEKNWMTIQACRITSRNTNIAMGQLVNEPVSFQGLLATPSAVGDTQFELDNGVRQKTD